MANRLPPTFKYLVLKVTVIAYVSILNYLVCAHIAKEMSQILFRYREGRTYLVNYMCMLVNVACIAVFAFFLRQISEIIPIPSAFETNSFDPSRVTEIKSSVLTAFTLFMFLNDSLLSFKPLFEYRIF